MWSPSSISSSSSSSWWQALAESTQTTSTHFASYGAHDVIKVYAVLFFAYMGFDVVSTMVDETNTFFHAKTEEVPIKNPVYLMLGASFGSAAKGIGLKAFEFALSMCDSMDMYGFTIDPDYKE
ncbi:hypothetical protein Fmac_013070 [Flemingia macrophylla]|uniref:Uncharacterized protein n=1 Tax=Flemingia macrophylla TaxID=520843 RepID=A0ABD1MS36_9FABA